MIDAVSDPFGSPGMALGIGVVAVCRRSEGLPVVATVQICALGGGGSIEGIPVAITIDVAQLDAVTVLIDLVSGVFAVSWQT